MAWMSIEILTHPGKSSANCSKHSRSHESRHFGLGDCDQWQDLAIVFCPRAHSHATNYYEIDLEETLTSPDAGIAFRYFWLLFRAKAFSDQPSFVDFLLSESASYAKALGERLKDNVFDNVFPRFAEGFVKSWGNPATELSEDELSETYHATLTFLYRLLFLLYAEGAEIYCR